MTDISKTKIDIKTVAAILIFVVGLVANNLKNDNEIKINAVLLEEKFNDKFNELDKRMVEFESNSKVNEAYYRDTRQYIFDYINKNNGKDEK